MFIVGADAVILFFAGDDPDAINNLKPYLTQVRNEFSEDVIKILISNMVNVEDRKFSYKEIKKISNKEGFLYAEKTQYDIDMILLACNYLRKGIPLSKSYKSIFSIESTI